MGLTAARTPITGVPLTRASKPLTWAPRPFIPKCMAKTGSSTLTSLDSRAPAHQHDRCIPCTHSNAELKVPAEIEKLELDFMVRVEWQVQVLNALRYFQEMQEMQQKIGGQVRMLLSSFIATMERKASVGIAQSLPAGCALLSVTGSARPGGGGVLVRCLLQLCW